MGATLLELFIQYVLPVLATLLAGGLAKLMQVGITAVDAKAKTNKVAAAGSKVLHLALSVVADLEVTLKPELQAACADGVLTKAEVLRLRDTALARLKDMLGTAGMAELQRLLGLNPESLDKYLLGQVERAVSEIPTKMRLPMPPGVPLVPQPAPA